MIVNSFESGQTEMLDKTLTTVAKNLDKDKNLGLAKTVLSRMIERKVRKLSDVYLTLGFAEISAKTDVKNVQQFFLNLISQGQIKALINQETQTVQFIDENQDSIELVKTLESQNQRVLELMEKAAAMNLSIKTNQDFIYSNLRKEKGDVDMN